MIPDSSPPLVSPRPLGGVRRTVSFALNDDEGDTMYPTVIIAPYTVQRQYPNVSNNDDDDNNADEVKSTTESTPLLAHAVMGCCVTM
jgi:hypothetical protein